MMEISPKSDDILIYMAGKITKNCWRNSILSVREAITPDKPWPVLPFTVNSQSFGYTGPFFYSCDHGYYHQPHSHGWASLQDNCCTLEDNFLLKKIVQQRDYVVKNCEAAIDKADVFFAWIDDLTCYGTLVELGYARAKGKCVVIGLPEAFDSSPIWFSLQLAHTVIFADNPSDVLAKWVQGNTYPQFQLAKDISASGEANSLIERCRLAGG